jgi:hypothetical protein
VATNERNRGPGIVVAAAAPSLAIYLALAVSGDLSERPVLYLTAHALLVALMVVAWRAARGGRRAWRAVLVSAVLFRLVMVVAPPTLSDDVYRYVWDGTVEAQGHHPYRFAPADPERAEFRVLPVYPRINHPEIATIYPPLAEMLFALLATAKLGVTGFKLATAALDVGVVAALVALLSACGLPRERAVLYAWNPLAVVETARGQLPHEGVHGIAILADEDDLPVVLDGEDGDGAGVPHDLAPGVDAAGLLDLVEIEGQDLARVDPARGEAAGARPATLPAAAHSSSVP